MPNQLPTLVVVSLCACTLRADFSYQETSRVTGGALAGAMKVAAVFSKEARGPIQTTVMVKGDRLAHLSATHGSIIDLSKETITNIDFQKKTYTVMTFAEMQQMMEQAQQKMKNAKARQKENPDAADVKFKVSVDGTGQTKEISGLAAKEMLLKAEMEATDTSTGQSGSVVVTMDMWLAPKVPGYEEVAEFHKRMGQKMKWTPGQNPMIRPEMNQGMTKLSEEAAKLEGMPVYSTMRMGGAGMQAQAAQPGAQPAEQPKQGPSAGSAVGNALGGRFGLGRRKPQQEQQQSGGQSQGQGQDASGLMMEMVTETGNFSAAPVDSAKFEVPAGFKQVDARANMR